MYINLYVDYHVFFCLSVHLSVSLTHSKTFSFSTLYQLFVDQFGPSLQYCHQEFDKEAIYDGKRSEKDSLFQLTLFLLCMYVALIL